MKIITKGIAFFAVNMIIEMCFVGGLLFMQHHLEAELSQSQHQQMILLRLNEVLRLWQENTTALLRYTIGGHTFTTQEQQNLYLKTKSEANILATVLLKEDKKNQILIFQVISILDEGFPQLKRVRDTYFSGDILGHLRIFSRLYHLSDSATDRIERVLSDYKSQLAEGLDRQKQLRSNIKKVLVCGVLFNFLLAGLGVWIFFKGIVEKLNFLQKNTLRFASEQPLLPPLATRDEMGALDRSFREMAATVKRSAEERFAVMENARDLIFSLSMNGAFLSCNAACEKLLAYDQEALIGMRLVNLVFEEDREVAGKFLQEAALVESPKPGVMRLVRADGQVVELLLSAISSKGADRIFCVGHDVTEARKLERLKRDFMLMVSHDMRSPLMSVHGVLTLLSEGAISATDEKGKNKLRATLAGLDRLMRMITDLLDVQKMEEGRLELNVEECNAGQIIEESVKAVAVLADGRDLAILTEPDEKVEVLGDRDRLVQVLVNILSNAIRFSPPEGTIRVDLEKVNGFVKFSVCDEGPGVPEDKLETIFQRFKQSSAAHSKAGSGFGLGLAICREMVHMHGGQIGVYNGALRAHEGGGNESIKSDGAEDDKMAGAVFWFTIPTATQQ